MYVNQKVFSEMLTSAAANFTPRRALTWGGYAAGLLGMRTLLEGARKVDDFAFPEWAEQKVEQPVFIFANGRSGTTMLHRLMGLDEENFAGFKLHQSMFSAVSIQRSITALGEGRLAPVWKQGVKKINKTFFDNNAWDGIHAMGIDKEEEDETTFVYCFESPSLSLLNPFMRNYTRLTWLDSHPEADRESFMDFYEATVKKHLYSVGGNRRFLNKNVFFAPRVRSMLSRFPDARFVYLLRHPFEALPSFASMYHAKWQTHSPELGKATNASREMIDMGYAYYRAGAALVRDLPQERIQVVRYPDLVADPRAVVEGLYDWMSLPMSPQYRARLNDATQKQRRYQSKHKYSLEEFGVTQEEVRRELADVFDFFGF